MLSTNDTTPKVQVRLNTVSGYQCSICMRKFLHLGTHRNHVTNAHHTPSLDPLEVEVKPKYYCPSPGCKKYFMTKYREKLHAERHCIKGDNQDKNNLKCQKCQKKFCKFKSLIQHLKQTHADVSTEEITEMEAKYAIRHMPYGEVTENSQGETYDDSLQTIPDRKDIQDSQDETCDDSMQTE